MTAVAKRCVLYVSGFDPKGASYYHALYRDESASQGKPGGQAPEVGARRRHASGNAFWSVQARVGEQQVETHYEFMRWDDVVRAHWPKNTWALWRDVIASSVFYLRHGTWWKMFRLAWAPAVAVLTPFLLVCALLLGVPLLAITGAWLASGLLGHWGLGVLAGGVSACVLWLLGRKIEARYNMYWMMRSYAFTARQARGEVPDLEARLDQLAQCLVDRVRQQADDEVLVVGHSSGAIMAAIIVARALRIAPDLLAGRTSVALLTLGQWIPLLGLLPMAHQFRAELQVLGAADGLTWTDFSAPPDGCCFALCDPFAACGIERHASDGVHLKLLNPRFATLFDAAAYRALKRDKFKLHFQYLRATDQPGAYNYFDITAGPLSLGERFKESQSVTGYTGLRPFGD